mgnify:CR=1 FL=1
MEASANSGYSAGSHCIETLELCVWETWGVADSLEDALRVASLLCLTMDEDRIRISTPDCRLI